MSKYDRDPMEFNRDLVITYGHPKYRDRNPLVVLRELRERRRGGDAV